jgi:dihydrolipoamide dehydrogenase
MGSLTDWEKHLMRERAKFIDQNTLQVGEEKIEAKKIIIATGSRPFIPKEWKDYRENIVTTDEFFELEKLPKKMAVFGLGVIGLELGQALNRLGVEVVACTTNKAVGGLTDPKLQDYVSGKVQEEMNVHFSAAKPVETNDKGQVTIKVEDKEYTVDKILMAVGRTPNIDQVDFDKTGIKVNDRGLPKINRNTMGLEEAPHIFIPGDVNNDRPILHEAADEGKIAGHNAVVSDETCFKRRTPLAIVFSDPNIASVGKNYQSLKDDKVEFVTGHVPFEGQGRSIVKLKEVGILHVYVAKKDKKILGAELQAPDGEHLAHLIAWAISLDLTVEEALRLPFYHPVVEEGLRTALRDASSQLDRKKTDNELFRCDDPPIR